MKRISSRQNPLVRRLRLAIRDHEDEIVVEGPKQVADAIASGWKTIAIVASVAAEPELEDRFGQDGPPAVSLSDDVFESVSDTRTSQGVLGLFERPKTDANAILARRGTVAVALDGVQDPGNVGTIVRLAAAFDASGVLLLPGCADPFGPKAIRASAGAILWVPVATVSSGDLIRSGMRILAADMSGAAVEPPARDAILLFGSEGSGVSEAILAHADTIAVPMSGKIESLNVASSAAILLARSYALRSG